MNNWLHYLSIPIVLIVVIVLFKNYKKRGKTNMIKQPKMYLYAGIFIAISGSLIALLFGLFPSEESKEYVWLGVIILLCFSMVGVLLIIWYLNFKIEFDKDNLIHTNIFRKKKIYKLTDLTYDSYLSRKDIYKKDKIVLTVNYLMENNEMVLDKLAVRKYNKNSTGTIKGNAIAKAFGITYLLLGVLVIVIFLLLIFHSENHLETILSYIFLTIGILMFCLGVFLILFRYIFKVRINESTIKITSTFGRTKSYNKRELNYMPAKRGYKIYHNNIQILYFNDNFTEQSKLVFVFDRKE